MDRGRLRYALVEMRVTVPATTAYSSAASAVKAAVSADAKRKDTVEEILDLAEMQQVDVIIFPGYTLVGRTIPSSVTAKVRDRYVVLELMAPDKSGNDATPKRRWRRTFVLGPGGRLCGPVRQRVVTSQDAWNGSGPSVEAQRVVGELDGERAPCRTWNSRGRTDTSLLVCGEVNLAYPERDGPTWAVDQHLLEALAACRVIVNPAHTPSTLPAMQRKREWLSERRALLTTANVHDGFTKQITPQDDAAGCRAAVAQATGAEAYIDGTRYSAAAIMGWDGAEAIDKPRYRVILFDL